VDQLKSKCKRLFACAPRSTPATPPICSGTPR
jgi:site-specific DNA recombinase